MTTGTIPACDWTDPETGECCDQDGPFGFGPPKITTIIRTCAAHREWGEAAFRERKRAEG